MEASPYFCPNCGWEGNEIICPVCGEKTENIDIDPSNEHGQPTDDEQLPLDSLEDFNDWEEDEDDTY